MSVVWFENFVIFSVTIRSKDEADLYFQNGNKHNACQNTFSVLVKIERHS